MTGFPYASFITLLAIAAYLHAGIGVGRARMKYGVKPPAVTGDPAFERAFRSQQNMLEWMPIFIPALWLFAIYVSDIWAGVLGFAWCALRVWYTIAYTQEAKRREFPFMAQFTCVGILWVGALIGLLRIRM